MSRYEPTADEAAAIELLTLAGFTVLRSRSYDALRERVRVAEALQLAAQEARDSCERWAHKCLDEERRLVNRLNAVCTGAAALGVGIAAINACLDVGDIKTEADAAAVTAALTRSTRA